MGSASLGKGRRGGWETGVSDGGVADARGDLQKNEGPSTHVGGARENKALILSEVSERGGDLVGQRRVGARRLTGHRRCV